MESLASFFSASGRIAPRPFAFAVIFVYVLGFLSQVLISPPLTARYGVLPFAVLQAALTWAWLALHAGRLRDAGRPVGPALGIAVLYVLAIVLLVLLIEPILGAGASTPATDRPRQEPIDLWVFALLLAVLIGPMSGGFFYYLALGILLLVLTPIVIAIGFSIATARQPSAPAAASHSTSQGS
jgi:uncharacterized membrane protein YhaH (DUF805 family)